ncbi:hypothetical protein OAQ86_06935, partial [Candidatus Pseudothioglobus singularis]|nr:hypothetical protein [Candidatus Pseudothioglobus singularis]
MWHQINYSKINNYLGSSLFPILIAILISLYNLNIGASLSPDSYRYIAAANNLINLEFNYFLFFDTYQIERFLPVIFPITLIALLKLVFPLEWMTLFIFINISLVFITFIFLQKMTSFLKINKTISVLCIASLIFSFDYLTWPRYILTDTIFSCLTILVIYFTLKIENFNIKNLSVWFLFFIFLAFTRQTCIPILAISMLLIFSNYMKLNYKTLAIFLIGLFFASAFLFSIILTILSNKSGLPYSNQVIEFINYAKSGVVIHHRPETYILIPQDISGFLKLFFYRFIYFFNPYISSFSFSHIVFNSILSLLYFLGLVIPIFKWNDFTYLQKKYFVNLNLYIVAIAIFHSATLIDFDWRYRFPAIIITVIVAAISINSLQDRLKK